MNISDCTKTIMSAIPTTNNEGNVTKWDLQIKYEYGEFVKVFGKTVTQQSLYTISDEHTDVFENFPTNKKPLEFTKQELIDMLPTEQYDDIFRVHYHSLYEKHQQDHTNCDTEFDVNNLQ